MESSLVNKRLVSSHGIGRRRNLSRATVLARTTKSWSRQKVEHACRRRSRAVASTSGKLPRNSACQRSASKKAISLDAPAESGPIVITATTRRSTPSHWTRARRLTRRSCACKRSVRPRMRRILRVLPSAPRTQSQSSRRSTRFVANAISRSSGERRTRARQRRVERAEGSDSAAVASCRSIIVNCPFVVDRARRQCLHLAFFDPLSLDPLPSRSSKKPPSSSAARAA